MVMPFQAQLPDMPDGCKYHAAWWGSLYKIRLSIPACRIDLVGVMIGAIALAMRKRVGVRRQSIAAQNSQRREDVLEIVEMPAECAREAADDGAAQSDEAK